MNHNTLQQIGPVILSIAVIIVVAVVRSYSKTLAAITATMPVTIPLSIWIIFSTGGERSSMGQFMQSLFLSMIGTVLFVVAAWLATRAGWGLVPIILAGYVTWGLTLLVLLSAQKLLGK